MVTMIDPNNADPKPSTTKPILNSSTAIRDASHNVTALITSIKRPIVKRITPQERKVSRGRIKAFTNPRMMAMTPTATQALESCTWIPGKSRVAMTRAMEVITHRLISFMACPPDYGMLTECKYNHSNLIRSSDRFMGKSSIRRGPKLLAALHCNLWIL